MEHKFPINGVRTEDLLVTILVILMLFFITPFMKKGLVILLWQLYDLFIRK